MGALFLALSLSAASVVGAPPARTISVQVVDLAGGVAFVKPGQKAGLSVGEQVQFADTSCKVLAVTEETAVLAMGERKLAVGAVGQAVITRPPHPTAGRRSVPVPVTTNLLGRAVLPASTQNPQRIPLSAAAARGHAAWDLVVTAAASSLSPASATTAGGPSYTSELRARGNGAVSADSPVHLDADASLLGWSGPGLIPAPPAVVSPSAPRPAYLVRELELRYGDHFDPLGAAGRLRQAAWTLGPLDGARVKVPLGEFSVGAFGGYLPNPITGDFSSDATRFGMELGWRAMDSDWRPEVLVVAHASRFQGQLDERRLDFNASAFGPRGGGTAYAEVSAFDANNPWNAPPVDLSAAGVDASWKVGSFRLGARGDTRTPERSLWLAAQLPQSWLCTAAPQAPGTPEPCANLDSRRWLGAVDGELVKTRFTAALGALTTSYGATPDAAQENEVFADVRVFGLAKDGRLMAGGHVGNSSLVYQEGGYAGFGRSFWDERVDLSLTWRPTVYSYNAIPGDTRVESVVEGQLVVAPRPGVELGLMGDLDIGEDHQSNWFLLNASWRPR